LLEGNPAIYCQECDFQGQLSIFFSEEQLDDISGAYKVSLLCPSCGDEHVVKYSDEATDKLSEKITEILVRIEDLNAMPKNRKHIREVTELHERRKTLTRQLQKNMENIERKFGGV